MLSKLYRKLEKDSFDYYVHKIAKLLNIRAEDVYVEECFYIQNTSNLKESDCQKVFSLLGLSQQHDYPYKPNANDLYILEIGPRLNFSTPFSTNCVSICKTLNLNFKRFEKSIIYYICLKDDYAKKKELFESKFLSTDEFYDKMTQEIYRPSLDLFQSDYLKVEDKLNVYEINVLKNPLALQNFNQDFGLGLDKQDINFYLVLFKDKLKRNPTNIECFDLAQSNSEHSRHWFFRGKQVVGNKVMDKTLMELVCNTQNFSNPNNVIKFSDNSSAILGHNIWAARASSPHQPSDYVINSLTRHVIFTAETHNFPTGVSPFPGAATGIGGRIRDVQATGRAALVIAGTAGYCVGNLHLPGYEMPWETYEKLYPDADFDTASAQHYPADLAAPLKILVEASNGASDYGNKFGEPIICGFTRSFGAVLARRDGVIERREWLKPIMFTGGIGSIEADKIGKIPPALGNKVVKIGGPVYRIGLGGGSASSLASHGSNARDLDFQAVQRGDPEMEQKMNRVVRACAEAPAHLNPLLSIHDQGAGGNGNVLKELVEPLGGVFQVSAFALGDESCGPMEIWAAEYQESNAALIAGSDSSEQFLRGICEREKCLLDVVGTVTGGGNVQLVGDNIEKDCQNGGDGSSRSEKVYVDLPLALIGSSGRQKTFYSQEWDRREYSSPLSLCGRKFDWADITIGQALDRVLRLVSVGSKRFLTNKVDRSVTGLVARQQCVGPAQIPLADAAIIALSHFGNSPADDPNSTNITFAGAVTAVGEQPIKTCLNPEAGARMALGEALTNLCAGAGIISDLADVKASFNWMWPAKEVTTAHTGDGDARGTEGSKIYSACEALCTAAQELGVAADGGKDSLGMAASFKLPHAPPLNGEEQVVTVKAPGSIVVSVYAPTPDITSHLTPDLKCTADRPTKLLWVRFNCDDAHPSAKKLRLEGSALFQAYGALGSELSLEEPREVSPLPDMDQPDVFRRCFKVTQALTAQKRILSAHDVSDGGLVSSALEMAFAAGQGTGLNLRLPIQRFIADPQKSVGYAVLEMLFAEELGLLLEVEYEQVSRVMQTYEDASRENQSGSIQCISIGEVIPWTSNNSANPTDGPMLTVYASEDPASEAIFVESMAKLKSTWEATAFELEKQQVTDWLCVEREAFNETHNFLSTAPSKSVFYGTTFPMQTVNDRWHKTLAAMRARCPANISVPRGVSNVAWRVAIIREEGTNGDRELAAAFISAGFETWDVTMTDLTRGKIRLDPNTFRGVAFAGGFSYGDVLGSARGWAASIRFNPSLNKQFEQFRSDPSTFALGVCNGCQLMALLGWVAPKNPNTKTFENNSLDENRGVQLKHNKSGRFESRFSRVTIQEGPCLFTQGMAGSLLGVWIAHGEGRMVFEELHILDNVLDKSLCPLRYVDYNDANPTEDYPANPNGSIQGIAGLCSEDGRHFALMPHPERSSLGWQWPWLPLYSDGKHSTISSPLHPFDSRYKSCASPWLKMFQNAYDWCDNNVKKN